MDNSLYENILKSEKYDNENIIEEALEIFYDFRKWANAWIARLEAEKEHITLEKYCEADKKAFEEVFKGGNTHANLGN